MPLVFKDSATCPAEVFLPDVPFGVVAMDTALMNRPIALKSIATAVRAYLNSSGIRW